MALRAVRLGAIVGAVLASSAAFGAAAPTIRVSPSSLRAGQIVRVYGVVPGCPRGEKVTLTSQAFAGAQRYAGVPAITATVGTGARYSVRTRIPSTRRPGTYRIGGRCGGGNLGVSATLRVIAAGAQPCQVAAANRHHVFRLNLDRDGDRERIDVFNSTRALTPVTGFMVCDRRGRHFVRTQLKYIFTSPGASTSGLVQAWAGDLNRDRRTELAIRDFITPSAGELLTVLRQRARHALSFSVLQTLGGDIVGVHRSPNAPATITVTIRANHAIDGRAHTERWSWSGQQQRWVCTADCQGH
jgi:hypothetical protein